MTIDVWMQHPNADFIKNPVFDSLRRWRPGAWSESSHPIEATLAEMDKAGVTCGMLCAWWGPSGPMISNVEVAHYCRAHPDRFIGIASVDLHRPMEGVRELRRRVKQDGFKGLRIVPWLWGLPPDDRRSVANLTFHSAHSWPRGTAQGIRARTSYPLSGSRRLRVSGTAYRRRPYRRAVARRDVVSCHEIAERLYRYVCLQGEQVSKGRQLHTRK